MTSDNISEKWTIVCNCDKSILQAHGQPIQVAICHCGDCRKAEGGEPETETLALIRRDQITSSLDLLKCVSGEQYNDKVPRYFCDSCDSYLLGDCTPIGFEMAIVPTLRISTESKFKVPDYHMHLQEGVSIPEEDGLPKYQGNPEDPYMARLVQKCS